MFGNREYEKRRLIQIGECSINTILILISVVTFFGFSLFRARIDRLFIFLYLFIGIELIGILGSYLEQACLTFTYICIDIVQIICACTSPGWRIVYFYLVSLVTSIRFLVSLYDELQRRQHNRMHSMPQAFSGVLPM